LLAESPDADVPSDSPELDDGSGSFGSRRRAHRTAADVPSGTEPSSDCEEGSDAGLLAECPDSSVPPVHPRTTARAPSGTSAVSDQDDERDASLLADCSESDGRER
jgi:hypothetical protein